MATERTVLVRLKANPSDFVRGMGTAAAAVKGLRHEIDTTSDRTAWLAQSILALGPTLAPLGAAAVPVFTGLATQMTMTGVAAGTLGLAFNGIGDALKALNDYQLDPTDAHLKKLDMTMAKIGPQGEQFVKFLDSLGPQLAELSNSARSGMFPGMEEGITHLLTLLPQVQRIVATTSETLGQLAGEAGAGLAGPRFKEFFTFLETDAKPILTDMGHTVGSFVDGLAAMLVAFAPVSEEFSHGFANMAASFADWAHGLDQSLAFQDFLDYIRESGPKALDLLGSMVGAIIGLFKAAAPVGEVMLPVLTKFFDLISAISDTQIGTIFLGAAAAASLYGRAVAIANVTTGDMFKRVTPGLREMNEQWRTTPIPTIREFGNAALHAVHSQEQLNTYFASGAQRALDARNKVTMFARSMGPTAAAVGLLATKVTGLDKKMGLTNATTLGLTGLMIGPWAGALGFAAGATMDLRHANDDLEGSIKQLTLAAKSGDFSNMDRQIEDLQRKIDDLKHTTGVGDFLSDTLKRWGSALNHLGDPIPSRAAEREAEAAIATAKLAQASDEASAKQELLAQGFEASNDGAKLATESTTEFKQSLEKLNAVLEGRASFRDYEAALDDFADRQKKRAEAMDKVRQEQSDFQMKMANIDRDIAAEQGKSKPNQGRLKDLQDQRSREIAAHKKRMKDLQDEADSYKNTLDVGTKAGRETQAALDNIASTAIKVAETLTGTERVTFLQAAKQDFIKAARAAGMTKAAAKGLADEVLGLDKITGHPKIVIDANGAFHVITDVERRLAELKDKKVTVAVALANMAHAAAVNAQITDIHSGKADGGTIRGNRYPYRDKLLVPLAPTEFVTSNRYGQADKNRAALEAGNRGATLAVVGMADGGTFAPRQAAPTFGHAGRAPVIGAGGQLRLAPADIAALATALEQARPMYGDAHFYGDHTQWRRQMQYDRRAAAGGGTSRG
jgi:hypothetical protein